MNREAVGPSAARLHHTERGAGSPVVVLHGFTGSVRAMRPITDLLAARHRVVAVDLVGHGESPAPASAEAYTMEAAVSGVDRVIETLDVAPVHVFGYSMGGRVALSYGVDHPDKVSSLVAVGASPGIADAAPRSARAAADAALADRIEREGIEWFVDYWSSLPIVQPVSDRGRAAAPAMRELRLRNDPVVLARVLRGLGPGTMPSLHDRFAGLDVPVLLVAGAADEKYREIADELAASLPDARAAVVDGAGHAVHLDVPRGVADLVIPFLAEVETGAGR